MSYCLECGYRFNKLEEKISTTCPECGRPTRLGKEKKEAETAQIRLKQAEKQARTERIERAKEQVSNNKISVIVSAVVIAVGLVCVIGWLMTLGRDLSIPSSRLVGHWKSPQNAQHYFGPQDSLGIGEYIYVARDSTTHILKYQVLAEVREKTGIVIEFLKRDGGKAAFVNPTVKFDVGMEGNSLRCFDHIFEQNAVVLMLTYAGESFSQ